jgi:hypothetical protein
MRKPSSHPLITFFVVFAFLAQVTGISGCGQAENAYKQATGQTVVDDGTVRSKLEIINQMSESVYDKILLISQDASTAKERAAAKDSNGMMAAFDRMSVNNNAMMSSLTALNAAEETLQKQKDAARQGGPHVSQQFLPIIIGAFGAAIALGTYLASACQKASDLRATRDAEPDPLKAAETQKDMFTLGHDVAGKLVTTIYSTGAGFSSTGAGFIADGIVAVTDTGNSGATEPKAIASSTSCASTPSGASPTDTGCKLFIGKATTKGSVHTFTHFPVDTSDITIFPKGVARDIEKGLTTAKDSITTLTSGLIKISDATAKKIKDSDAGTDSAPSDGGGTTTPPAPPPASDPLPWSYSGSLSFTARVTANYGNHGVASCTTHGTEAVTLNADGSLTGSADAGYYATFDAAGNALSCTDKSYPATFTGTHSNGYYTMTSNTGKSTNGSYTASSLTGTGSWSGAQTLSDGSPVTVDLSWIITLKR